MLFYDFRWTRTVVKLNMDSTFMVVCYRYALHSIYIFEHIQTLTKEKASRQKCQQCDQELAPSSDLTTLQTFILP